MRESHNSLMATRGRIEELVLSVFFSATWTVHAREEHEGDFWEKRDVQALVPEIQSWNGMLAAFAGQLKDAIGDGVQAPITEYPNFEHLEQAGLPELPPESAQLAKLIQQVVKRP